MSRDVGVGQLVEDIEQRGDRLPFEIGAFVALEACEGLLQASVKLEPDDVRVTHDGSVVVAQSATAAEPDEAAQSLVSVLARLLVAAGPGVPPYLLQLVKESTTGQTRRDLRGLHDAIEASLIPINRGASRRVLARLVRESDRPPAPEPAQVDAHALDAELDELLRDPELRTIGSQPVTDPEEPITQRIRIPKPIREVPAEPAAEPDPEPDLDPAAVALRHVSTLPPPPSSSPPPPPEHPDTLPSPPSEPIALVEAERVIDLTPPPAPSPAAALARDPAPAAEPITSTIRKWQPAEDDAPVSERVPVAPTVQVAEGAEAATARGAAAATEAVPASATEAVSAPVTVSAPEAVSTSAPATEGEATWPQSGSTGPAPEREASWPHSGTTASGSVPGSATGRRNALAALIVVAAAGLLVAGAVTTGALESVLPSAAPSTTPAPSGRIDITVAPAEAQIFVFIGRGPAVSVDRPLGSAHEFIVFDEGLRPTRAVVPAGATWATTEGGPLYELAVQAQPIEQGDDAIDLGVPSSDGAGSEEGPTGDVRVVTNPPGAKVYRFVGTGPNASIPVSSIHEGQEVLVYHPGHESRRAVVGPSDWTPSADGDAYGARLQITLPASPGSTDSEPVEN